MLKMSVFKGVSSKKCVAASLAVGLFVVGGSLKPADASMASYSVVKTFPERYKNVKVSGRAIVSILLATRKERSNPTYHLEILSGKNWVEFVDIRQYRSPTRIRWYYEGVSNKDNHSFVVPFSPKGFLPLKSAFDFLTKRSFMMSQGSAQTELLNVVYDHSKKVKNGGVCSLVPSYELFIDPKKGMIFSDFIEVMLQDKRVRYIRRDNFLAVNGVNAVDLGRIVVSGRVSLARVKFVWENPKILGRSARDFPAAAIKAGLQQRFCSMKLE